MSLVGAKCVYYASRSKIDPSRQRQGEGEGVRGGKKVKKSDEDASTKIVSGSEPSSFDFFFIFFKLSTANVRALSEMRRAVCLNCRGTWQGRKCFGNRRSSVFTRQPDIWNPRHIVVQDDISRLATWAQPYPKQRRYPVDILGCPSEC